MATTVMTVTGAEALEDLQRHFPHDWQRQIADAEDTLNSFARIYKTDDLGKAYSKLLRHFGRPDNAIALLAALYVIRKRDREQSETLLARHTALETRALRIEEQLQRVPATNWDPAFKEKLKDYYHGRLAMIQDAVSQIINQMPVFGAIKI